jgi:hypothetical protein
MGAEMPPGELSSSVDVLLTVLSLMETALDAPTRVDATLDARAAAAGLELDMARRAAAAAAVLAAWSMRGWKNEAAVRRWLDRQRLEATWAGS